MNTYDGNDNGNIIKSIEIQKDGVLYDLYTTSHLELWTNLTTNQEKEKISLRNTRTVLNSFISKK